MLEQKSPLWSRTLLMLQPWSKVMLWPHPFSPRTISRSLSTDWMIQRSLPLWLIWIMVSWKTLQSIKPTKTLVFTTSTPSDSLQSTLFHKLHGLSSTSPRLLKLMAILPNLWLLVQQPQHHLSQALTTARLSRVTSFNQTLSGSTISSWSKTVSPLRLPSASIWRTHRITSWRTPTRWLIPKEFSISITRRSILRLSHST